MGLFTKLLDFGWLVARDVEKQLASDSISDSLVMERKLPDIGLNEIQFWNNFFDVDLKKLPNESWREEGNITGKAEVHTFKQKLYVHSYFKYVEAHVVGDTTTNFKFTGKYSWISAVDIYFMIESELMQRRNPTAVAAAQEIKGRFNTVYQCIRQQNDKEYLEMSRDITTRDIELLIITTFYNRDFLT